MSIIDLFLYYCRDRSNSLHYDVIVILDSSKQMNKSLKKSNDNVSIL